MSQAVVTKVQNVSLWAAPTIISCGFLLGAIAMSYEVHPSFIPLAVGAPFVILAWVRYLSVPRTLSSDGTTLVFERPLGRLVIPIVSVTRIDARRWNGGFVILKASKTRVYLLRDMPDISIILGIIQRLHPAVTIQGDFYAA